MFILGGIIQGFILSLVIALRSKAANHPLRLLGGFIFFLSLIGVDVYLCQTGLMKYTLWANNSTEPLILLLGPTIYFFARGLLNKETLNFPKHWIHLLLPIAFLITQIGYYIQPEAVKLNAYLGAYFPNLPLVVTSPSAYLDFSLMVSSIWRFLLVGSMGVYILLTFRLVGQHQTKLNTLFVDTATDKYNFTKNLLWLCGIALGLILLVYTNFETDLGDQYIAFFFSLGLYLVSFFMLAESRFFEKAWLADKYDTSGIKKATDVVYQKAVQYVEQEQYYLKKEGSLKDLATQLSLPANYLSQAINQQNQNFNDFINQYRIEEAKKRLGHSDYAHLNIAGIGETVGFKSKSAFYAAFKKQTQLTPTAFIKKEQRIENRAQRPNTSQKG